MSPVTDIWRQLVDRRLWPVAALLAAALPAVPVVLATHPEPAATAPASAPTRTGADPLGQPVVTLASLAVLGRAATLHRQ